MALKALESWWRRARQKAIGPYSQAVVGDGMVYTAGQIPLDPKSGGDRGKTTAEQAEQCSRSLGAILKPRASAGPGRENHGYLIDMADFPATERGVREVLPDAQAGTLHHTGRGRSPRRCGRDRRDREGRVRSRA